jgi:hypothetical protein
MRNEGGALPGTPHNANTARTEFTSPAAAPVGGMSATAYERIVDKLHDLDLKPHTSYGSTVALCPSHDDRQPSLAVYDKDGRAKVVCFAGCDDALDILPALEMSVSDLYDERRSGRKPSSAFDSSRAERRKTMTPPHKATDDLMQLPDLGERLCLAAARQRPELYIWEREQLWTDPASDASDASHASDSQRGRGSGA